MDENNKEKIFPEGTDESPEDTKVPENEVEENDSDWKWDASVPETDTDNITIEDLSDTGEEAETDTETEAEAEDSGVSADEASEDAEDADAEAEEPREPRYCIVCGKEIQDDGSDLYCEICRKKYMHTNYGIGSIILAFVMVIAAALGYFVCTATCQISDKLVTAEMCVDTKRYNDAVDEVTEAQKMIETLNTGVNGVFSHLGEGLSAKEWFIGGEKLDKLLISAYADVLTANTQECEMFVQMVEKQFSVNELKRPENKKIKETYEFCKDLNEFTAVANREMQKFMSGKTEADISIDYDKAMKYLADVDPQNQAQECLVEYYRFLTAYYADKGQKEIMSAYDKTFKAAGDFGYLFIPGYMSMAWDFEDYETLIKYSEMAVKRNINDTSAYYFLVKSYLLKGDYDRAGEYCEELGKNNPKSLDYYSIKAELLRREGKFKEAVEICKKGIAEGVDAEIYRQQSIAYLLMGNKEAAAEASKQAYDITLQSAYSGAPVSLEILNTSALVSCVCDDMKTYDEINKLFKDQGWKLEESVQKCIKGEITPEDLFMKGKGEV